MPEDAPHQALVPDESGAPFSRMDGSMKLFVYLAAIFVSCLLLGDIIGGKTITTPTLRITSSFTLGGPISVGMIPFPVTFLLTDIVNEFYGRKGARFLTLLGFAMAVLAWTILQLSTWLTPHESTYFLQAEFAKIFGGSAQLFVASIIAYMVGQFLDINVFQFWKALTKSKHLWLRATGSTALSQVADTVIINVIFWSWTASSDAGSFLGKMSSGEKWGWIFSKIGREYGIKLVIAVLLTPVVYALHEAIVRWLRLKPSLAEKKKR